MALEFRPPPDWLLNEYFNRKQPIEVANEGIQQALQTYAALNQQKQSQQQAATGNYLKLLELDPDLLKTPYGQALSKQSGASFEGYQPPTASSPTVAGVVPAGQVDPTSSALPSAEEVKARVAAMQGRGKLGQNAINQLKTNLEMQKTIQGMGNTQEKFEENGPKSFDYARAFAASAGAKDAAESFIKIAQAEGRNSLTKREMDDMKNAVNASAQKGRGEYFSTMAGVREQALRDQLIKEARTTLDPYFQSGVGKQQAERLNRIGRAEVLAQQMQQQRGSGDSRQMRELATSLASVLTGGNVVAQNQIEELIPQTYKGKLNKFIETLTNNPTGLDQQKFVDRFVETLAREKAAIHTQNRAVAERSAPTLRVLKSQYPEDYNAVVDNYLKGSPEIMGSNADSTPVTEDGWTYTPGPGGRANQANWKKQ